jgi:hypothetical protein
MDSTCISTLTHFYNDEEVSNAKSIMIEIGTKHKIDELKQIKSRIGDGKKMREVEDIYTVYSALRNRDDRPTISHFYAADISRILTKQAFDLSNVHVSLQEIKLSFNDKLNELSDNLTQEITKLKTQIEKSTEITDRSSTTRQPTYTVTERQDEISDSSMQDIDISGLPNLALNADTTNTVNIPWNLVLSRSAAATLRKSTSAISHPKPVRGQRKTGAAKNSDANPNPSTLTAAIKTPGPWHIYVGKMSPDATEDLVKQHLEANGIEVIRTSKLKAEKEWQKKSSAFRISIANQYKDSVMDPNLWPQGIEVRDWVFKEK